MHDDQAQVGPDAGAYQVVVLGVSSGGVRALRKLLPALPAAFSLPILIVSHVDPGETSCVAAELDEYAAIRVIEAKAGETPVPGVAYLAPAGSHLRINGRRELELSADPPVNFARPSVDVLFDSAAAAFGPAVVGVVLTGAGSDGARGLRRIKEAGGFAIVQDPASAEIDSMPRSALFTAHPDRVVSLDRLPELLRALAGQGASAPR